MGSDSDIAFAAFESSFILLELFMHFTTRSLGLLLLQFGQLGAAGMKGFASSLETFSEIL